MPLQSFQEIGRLVAADVQRCAHDRQGRDYQRAASPIKFLDECHGPGIPASHLG
jgi:hypothetical protein